MHLKILFCLLLIVCSGCQSAPRKPVPASAPSSATAPSFEAQEKNLRQQQHIQALIAQNEALHSRVRELETPPAQPLPEPLPPPVAVVEPVMLATVVPDAPIPPIPADPERTVARALPLATQMPAEPAILPNAEGLIDLVVLLTPAREGDEVNPFAVRRLPPDAVREVTLYVQGVIHGASPCALINHRAVLPGESADSLNLAAVESDAVLIRHAGRLLRLPVSEKAVRIRLPL